MSDEPNFFFPQVEPEKQEAAYAEVAAWSHQTIPERRIYSITYAHDGEEWTATVGEFMSGVRYRTRRSRGERIETKQHLSDSAMVLAIFPGVPFFVVTDSGGGRSKWENPFMAGRPKKVKYFAVQPSAEQPVVASENRFRNQK
jgi:hypothetical protein